MYKFDPTKFGFEPIENFEEDFSWYGGGDIYIKVIATHDTPGAPDRKVFWYTVCKMPMSGIFDDNRIKFFAHSYDSTKKDNWFPSPRVQYFGLISTDAFAKDLLMHIFGTTQNDSVQTDGLERLNMNINHLIKPIHDNKD